MIDISNINGREIIEYINEQIGDNEDLCDISLSRVVFVDQETENGKYTLKFDSYWNNWGEDTPTYPIQSILTIKKFMVKFSLGEPCDGDGTEDALEEVIGKWLQTHEFDCGVGAKFEGLVRNSLEALNEIRFDDKKGMDNVIDWLTEARTYMK